MPATLPTKTAADLGEVLSNTKAPKTNQLSAVNVEKIKDWLITLATELGLTDGSTAGSVWEAVAALRLLSADTITTIPGAGSHLLDAADEVIKFDSSGTTTLQVPNPGTLTGRLFLILDVTGNAEGKPLTLQRSAGGEIDGVAADKDLATNYGRWLLWTDGTNFFTFDCSGAAGAILDSDFAGAELGRLTRTGVGTYAVVKDALAAGIPPGVGNDSTQGYTEGSLWVIPGNASTGAIYVCQDATVGAAVWVKVPIDAYDVLVDTTGMAYVSHNTVNQALGDLDAAIGNQASLIGDNTASIAALYGMRTVTTSAALLDTDRTVLVDGSAGATIDLTLPDPTTYGIGRPLRIKKIAGRARVRVVPHGAEKIEGTAATYVLPDSSPLIDGDWWVATDGTDWRVGGSDKDIHLDRKNRIVLWRDDFVNNTVAQWLTELSGSGAAVALMSAASACPGGSLNLITGSTATGIAGLRSAINLFYSTRFDFLEMCSVASLSNLDDGIDTFHADMCAAGGPSFAAGWAIRYDQSISANWRLVRFAGGVVAAAVDTGVAATAGLLNQQHRFRTVYDRVNDKIDAYIDGASVASLNGFGVMSALYLYPTRIEKTANINSRGVNLDYTYAVAVPASTAAYRA